MGTPQKNFGQELESPYAKHLPQYPSQSEGFVPNDFGGKMWIPSSSPSKQYQGNYNYQQNSDHRRRGNNRYYNVNRGAGSSGNNGGGHRNNYHNNFQNNYDQQHTNRYSNSGNRQQPYYGQKFNKSEGNSRNDYYHPSMLWDPWKDLLDRHNAIKNSQINVPATSTPEKEQEPSSSTNQDAITTAIPTTTVKTSTSISP